MIGPKTKVILQKPVETRTATGGQSADWTQIQEFDAVISPMSAFESDLYNRRGVTASYKLLVDYSTILSGNLSEVKEKNRIKVGTTLYNIIGVKNQFNRHFEVDLQVVK